MKSPLAHPVRMIDFISGLYASYKVLNKLSEKESVDFQREVVTSLVDSKENVDRQAFQSVLQPLGIEGFVLQVLAKVINRSPFKNQFELNRNLAAITENIKKEQDELQKRQKVLQRKEEKLKATEDGLMASVKQKMQSFENEAIQRIVKKEAEIRKNITQLLNQLKAKEKLVFERYQQSKNNAKILLQLEQKERLINQKLKSLQKKEKQARSKDSEGEALRKEAEMQQYKEQIQKLRQGQREAVKRYKNLELAYKKIKNDKSKPECSLKAQTIPKLAIRSNNIIQFDDLQLSGIHQAQKNDGCEQFITYIDLQQASGKLESVKRILTKPQSNNELLQLSQIRQLLNIRLEAQQQIVQIGDCQQPQDEQRDSQEFMPGCLSPITERNGLEDAIAKINSIALQGDQDKLKFVKQHTLLKFIDQCYELNTPHQLCELLLSKILELIEESAYYLDIISYLAAEKVVQFLQRIYLSHQTNADIIETATLILSRIKLKDFELKLSNQFIKALQIRLRVESKGSFLYGNVHFILN